MERKISLSLYALALLLTVIVFSVGVFVGHLFDQSNQQALSADVDAISQKVQSTQLLMLLDDNSSSFCPVYKSQLDLINSEVELIGHKLTYLEEEKESVDVPLKKSYFVLEAQSYLLSKRINERCGENSTLLLYFYSNKDCFDCKQMGNEILSARDDLGSSAVVKIYSFDGDLGSPVSDALLKQYQVSTYPSIVVNGKLYSGNMDKAAIKSALVGE